MLRATEAQLTGRPTGLTIKELGEADRLLGQLSKEQDQMGDVTSQLQATGKPRRRGATDRSGAGLQLEAVGKTDVGRRRAHNEDSFLLARDLGLFLVCDGMGGAAAGEVASRLTVEAVEGCFRSLFRGSNWRSDHKLDRSMRDGEQRLIVATRIANDRVRRAAREQRAMSGMGTTLVGALATGEGLHVAHVGDSRAYRLRAGELQRLTEDHSLLNEALRERRLTDREIEDFPYKYVITRAVGTEPTVDVETQFQVVAAGDVCLLCSDGLTGPVSDPEIADVLGHCGDLEVAATRLIEAANDRGGPDNVTVVLLRWT
jgi:protein phosphatase